MKKTTVRLTFFLAVLTTVVLAGLFFANKTAFGGVTLSIVFLGVILIVGLATVNLAVKKLSLDLEETLKVVLAPGIGVLVLSIVFLAGRLFFLKSLPQYTLASTMLVLIAALVLIRKDYLASVRKEFLLRKFNAFPTIATVVVAMVLSLITMHVFVNLNSYSFEKPDGAYVYKNENLHVRIQNLTGDLPADNYISFVVSQFLIQGVSFSENRPLLPGQEVTNRPILMSLATSQVQSFLHPQNVDEDGKIGTFKYLNIDWPDSEQFGYDNTSFYIFFSMAIALNLIFVLPAFFLGKKFFGSRLALLATLGLFIMPFVFNQVIFTWPKFLMAYYLLAALCIWFGTKQRSPLLAGIYLGLAYLSHPSALIYIAFAVMYFSLKFFLTKKDLKSSVIFVIKLLVTIGVVLIPWFIWASLVLKISSDLITQNLVADSYAIGHLIYVRLTNLANLFFVWQSTAGDFSTRLYRESILSVPGSLLLFSIPMYYYLVKYFKKYLLEILLLGVGPVFVLSLVWGKIGFSMSILFSHATIALMYILAVGLLAKRNRLVSGLFLFVQFLLFQWMLWLVMYNVRQATTINWVEIAMVVLINLGLLLSQLFLLGSKDLPE